MKLGLKELAAHLQTKNNFEFNLLKLQEELLELSVEIAQIHTKGKDYSDLLKEFADVKIRMKVIEKSFKEEEVEVLKSAVKKKKTLLMGDSYVGTKLVIKHE